MPHSTRRFVFLLTLLSACGSSESEPSPGSTTDEVDTAPMRETDDHASDTVQPHGSSSSGSTGAESSSSSGSTVDDPRCGNCLYAQDCGLLEGTLEACVEACTAQLDAIDNPACLAATVALQECHAEATCDGVFETCSAQFDAEYQACSASSDEPMCIELVHAAPDASECRIEQTCTNLEDQADYAQRIECDGTSCTCLADGEDVGSCDADGLCPFIVDANPKDPATLEHYDAFAMACCGFEPVPL